MVINLLTNSEVSAANHHTEGKLKGKPKRYNDGGGLYLIVFKFGLKSWRYNFVFDGKQQTITYGSYPNLSLSEARYLHSDAVRLKNQGINPALKKQTDKYKNDNTMFAFVADEWLEKFKAENKKSTKERKHSTLEII